MFQHNVVVLRGRVTSEPRRRELPSGSTVVNLEVSTVCDDTRVSVPVAVHASKVACGADDEVVVVGHVRRRFFRAGGITQSRTEVVAADVVRATRKRTVERLLAGVSAVLATDR